MHIGGCRLCLPGLHLHSRSKGTEVSAMMLLAGLDTQLALAATARICLLPAPPRPPCLLLPLAPGSLLRSLAWRWRWWREPGQSPVAGRQWQSGWPGSWGCTEEGGADKGRDPNRGEADDKDSSPPRRTPHTHSLHRYLCLGPPAASDRGHHFIRLVNGDAPDPGHVCHGGGGCTAHACRQGDEASSVQAYSLAGRGASAASP